MTYISRDYAVENMENFPWDTEHDRNAAIHLVRELVPAADVVEVVRCGECVHRTSGWTSCQGRPKDWFCANGVMRGEGTDSSTSLRMTTGEGKP